MQQSFGRLENIESVKKVYFIGIGGIGMSAIARYFLSKNVAVSGYDKTKTDLTTELEEEGMQIHYSENLDQIPKDADLVVFTPAVPKDQAELVYYQENGYPVVKRSDVLEAISARSFNICVAGTHGKTTISTLIAHILKNSGFGCNAFLGGISVNYGTNFWSSNKDVCVIEADEYDRSFLKLSPNIAVISAMDADHLDIYGDESSMQDAFIAFAGKIKEDGLLLNKFGLKRIKEARVSRKLSYSVLNDAADLFARNVKIKEGGYEFEVLLHGEVLSNFELRIGGMHNVENALVAIGIANELGISMEKIKEAVALFRGVKRRFEYIIPPQKQEKGAYLQPVLVDDYAHHPEELKALLNSVRSLFPGRVLTIVFQPHLYSRTRDLAGGFASALSLADRVILLPIYPARELPIEGVSSQLILDGVENTDKMILTKEGLMRWMEVHAGMLDKQLGEVIVMAGAGDIDSLVRPIAEILKTK